MAYNNKINVYDCGLEILQVISDFYSIKSDVSKQFKDYARQNKGVTLNELCCISHIIGFETHVYKCSFDDLLYRTPMPCIAHVDKQHYIGIFKMTSSHALIFDANYGFQTIKNEEFIKRWIAEGLSRGIIVSLLPV